MKFLVFVSLVAIGLSSSGILAADEDYDDSELYTGSQTFEDPEEAFDPIEEDEEQDEEQDDDELFDQPADSDEDAERELEDVEQLLDTEEDAAPAPRPGWFRKKAKKIRKFIRKGKKIIKKGKKIVGAVKIIKGVIKG